LAVRYRPGLRAGSLCIVLSLVVAAVSCNSSRFSVDVSDIWPGRSLPSDASAIGMIHRGGDFCAHSVVRGGVTFSVDVVCGATTIVYLQTQDRGFRTPEGLVVGGNLARARSISRFDSEDHCAIKLSSGWVAKASRTNAATGCAQTIEYFEVP
jgi:hypothetical protein